MSHLPLFSGFRREKIDPKGSKLQARGGCCVSAHVFTSMRHASVRCLEGISGSGRGEGPQWRGRLGRVRKERRAHRHRELRCTCCYHLSMSSAWVHDTKCPLPLFCLINTHFNVWSVLCNVRKTGSSAGAVLWCIAAGKLWCIKMQPASFEDNISTCERRRGNEITT